MSSSNQWILLTLKTKPECFFFKFVCEKFTKLPRPPSLIGNRWVSVITHSLKNMDPNTKCLIKTTETPNWSWLCYVCFCFCSIHWNGKKEQHKCPDTCDSWFRHNRWLTATYWLVDVKLGVSQYGSTYSWLNWTTHMPFWPLKGSLSLPADKILISSLKWHMHLIPISL